MTNLDGAQYRHEKLLLSDNQINKHEIPLHGISYTHILPLVQSFRAYEFDHARGAPSVTTSATVAGFELCEGAPPRNPLRSSQLSV